MTQPKWGTKLTIGTLKCKPAEAVKGIQEINRKVPIAVIYGKATDVRFQQDINRGISYLYFAGTFEGVNVSTGETQASNKLYLPDGVAEMVEDVVKKAKGRQSSVDFAVEISVMRSEGREGYEYDAVFLKKPAAVDELEMLRDVATTKAKQLKPASKSA